MSGIYFIFGGQDFFRPSAKGAVGPLDGPCAGAQSLVGSRGESPVCLGGCTVFALEESAAGAESASLVPMAETPWVWTLWVWYG